MIDLCTLTLTQAAGKLRAREISACELTEAYLARIDRLDRNIHAYITVTANEARSQAQAADEALARGIPVSPLHGIPFAIKDLFDMRQVKTTAGSKILRDNVPARDAAVVERLRAGGAVFLGKLNMHEFAFGVTNENPHYGRVQNPWKLSQITGGSSGGSAAAVAARMALATIGSDTGGSIRIPAALCGVTGLKPTYGRVSLRGAIPLSWSNDHAGPLSRDAADAAVVLQAIAGYDRGDPVSMPHDTPQFTARRGDLRGLRVTLGGGYWARRVEPEILTAVAHAMDILVELGAERVEREVPEMAEVFACNRTILSVEAAAFHRDMLARRSEEYGEDVLRRLRAGEQFSGADYAWARRKQVEYRRKLERFFDDVDLLVTPTTRILAPQAGSQDPVRMAEDLTAFTAPFNVTGLPALSLPCGFSGQGLPIGMQVVTRPWDELLLLQTGQLYQGHTNWHTRTPEQ